MTVASPIARLRHYHRTHGTAATLRRIRLAFQRFAAAGQFVLYYCELPIGVAPLGKGTVGRVRELPGLADGELNRLICHWHPELMRRRMAERFAQGAELWLLRWSGIIAAYGWTLKGKTIEPHFFPVNPGDVHLFDFFVFPEFRGRGLNPALVRQILTEVGQEGSRRALIEAAAWNEAQRASLAKTPFVQLGFARKLQVGKAAVVWWSKVAR